MDDRKRNILQKLKDNLTGKFGDTISRIILFGSQSTHEDNELSDYDILIVLKQDQGWLYKDGIYSECYKVELQEDVLFDITIISENEISNTLRGKQPFILNALTGGIVL